MLSGCGVKGSPVAPENQNIPSVLDNYTDVQIDQTLKDSETKRK